MERRDSASADRLSGKFKTLERGSRDCSQKGPSFCACDVHIRFLLGRVSFDPEFCIPSFLTSSIHSTVTKLPIPPIKVRREPIRPVGSIIKEMSSNTSNAFSGYGRHCINDFLYQLAIFPGTPPYIICEDEGRYQEFKTELHEYMFEFSKDEFLDETATVPRKSDGNPFVFNDRSNRVYTSKYIDVFRRTSKLVPREKYNRYLRAGLFDKEHTIGQSLFPSNLFWSFWLIVSVQALNILGMLMQTFANQTPKAKKLMCTLLMASRHIR